MKYYCSSEIGSEFWDIPVSDKQNSLLFEDTSWFLSGRSALQYIIADIKKKQNVRRVALPAWCCDSMIVPFIAAGIEVDFYPVRMMNGALNMDIPRAKECDIVFLMDYFGYTSDFSLCDYDGIVIRDVTHSLFSKTYTDAHYYFGSLRKWAGFLSGGYAIGAPNCALPTDEEYIKMRSNAMDAKKAYICGKTNDKGYLAEFERAEEHLDVCNMAGAAMSDIKSAMMLDVEFIKASRRRNAAKLVEAFGDIAMFKEFSNDDCPMFVPILVPDGKRTELRRHLISNEIYCPVHWPLTKYHNVDEDSLKIYNNELSLVCDQRYDENDMERIIKVIREF